MYQALYRKYRPLQFADVVGQGAVTQTLTRQIASGRFAHAYLFTGTRGTGKTTCAKIFARAVNCSAPIDGNPCNECESCKGILNGSILDIYEIDAASNNSVGDVRELREDVIYTPASTKYKVYIIDEVHRMSGAAFDALLKTIEEPPSHVIFVLATTELHKVPATILSRCQRFDFRRIDAADIAARLQYVAEKEKLTLTDEAAKMLARMGQGSMRDALSLLERTVAIGDTIDGAAVGELLGICDPQMLLDAAENIMRGDTAAVLRFLDAMWYSSKDTTRLLEELAALLRDVMLAKISPEMVEVSRGKEQQQRILEIAQNAPLARVLYMIETLQKGMRDISAAEDERVMTELVLIRLCEPSLEDSTAALSARIAALEAGQPITPSATKKQEPTVAKPPVSDPIQEMEPPPPPEAPIEVPQEVQTAKAENALSTEAVIAALQAEGRPDIGGMLKDAKTTLSDNTVMMQVSGFANSFLSMAPNLEVLKKAVSTVVGRDVSLRLTDQAQAAPKEDLFLELADEIENNFE